MNGRGSGCDMMPSPTAQREGTFISLGTERKSALLCQLHDGPACFAPAFGGVQEAGFACVWRAGPSVSQAICSSCASSLGSSRALCAASHGPASDPGRTRLDLQAGSCRAEPRGDPCWLRAPAGAARSGSAGAGRRQNLPHGTVFLSWTDPDIQVLPWA